MPVNKHLAQNLKKQYGSKKGEQVYFAMENSNKKSFKKGLATAKREKHTVAHFPKKGKNGRK